MKREVKITVHTVQYAGGGKEAIDSCCRGTLETEDGVTVLNYDEEGGVRTHTRLIITPLQVDLLRSGEVSMRAVFREGKTHETHYCTGQGCLSLNFATRRLVVGQTERGHVDLRINYDLTSVGTRLAVNDLCIRTSDLE